MHLWIPKFTIPFKMPLDTSQCLPKSLCAVSSSNEKKSVVMILINFSDDTVRLRPLFFGAFSFPHLSQNTNDYISPKKRAIFYIILHILSIYCIFGSSNLLGLVVGSQLGLFVVSSLGAKHGAFHSEDETQKVGSSGGQGVPKRARAIRRHKKIQKDIKTTELG